MTAQDIIDQARERLGDEKAQRWSASRLLTIVSQGQTDICIETGYLRKEVYIPATKAITVYTLPFDCFSIKRVEFRGDLLPLHARSDKDANRAISKDYTAYKSNLKYNRLEIQPAPLENTNVGFVKGELFDAEFHITPLYGVVYSTNSPLVSVEPDFGIAVGARIATDEDATPSDGYGEIGGFTAYSLEDKLQDRGVTVGIDYEDNITKFGFISGLNHGHIVTGQYGLSGNVSYIKDTFRVFYVAVPARLVSSSAVLVIPDIWEELLLRYVVGTALQDDNDSNNIQRGELELQKYTTKLSTLQDASSKDFSADTSSKNETEYRRV